MVNKKDIPDYVATCMHMAMLLEVSAYPKPGNVHRFRDFKKTRYEHYLASSSALYRWFREAASKGLKKTNNLGLLIRHAVNSMICWQRGGNTSLGAILLLMPLAYVAGKTILESYKLDMKYLRKSLKNMIHSLDYENTLHIASAIMTVKPAGLKKVPYLDVLKRSTYEEIKKKRIKVLDFFKPYANLDSIAREWTTAFKITFELGYKTLKNELEEHGNLNAAIVNTFLKILSEVPDTHIARKFGFNLAYQISHQAKKVLKLGGSLSKRGNEELWKMDKRLTKNRILNPGATADLTTSSISLLLLEGYRP